MAQGTVEMTYDQFVALHGEEAWRVAQPRKFAMSEDVEYRNLWAPTAHATVMKWVRLIDPNATGILDIKRRLGLTA